MRALPKPALIVRDVVAACAQNIQNQDLCDRLELALPTLEAGEIVYNQHGDAAQLYQIVGTEGVAPGVTTAEMTSLYDHKLSREGQPGRPYYNILRASSPLDICPLCAHRSVSTLDHYLAKSSHPAYAVTPLNLVPACLDCNKTKHARQPANAEDQTFHPYFDNVEDAIWLTAVVVENAPPAVLFAADPPGAWVQVKQERVRAHFLTFGLATLYGSNAAQELAQISFNLNRIANDVGPVGVRLHLEEQAVSRQVPARNSWQAAFYAALAASEWFWNGGHRNITA